MATLWDLAAGIKAASRQRDLGRCGLRRGKTGIGLAAVDRVLHHMIDRGAGEVLHVVQVGGLQFLPVPEDDKLFHVSVPSMPR